MQHTNNYTKLPRSVHQMKSSTMTHKVLQLLLCLTSLSNQQRHFRTEKLVTHEKSIMHLVFYELLVPLAVLPLFVFLEPAFLSKI